MASVLGKIKPGVMEWSKDFSAQRIDEKGKYEATWTYNCHINDIFKFQPATGAACEKEGWEFLQVSGLPEISINGVVASITVKFNGYPDGEDSQFDKDSKYSVDETIGNTNSPIATHKKFDDCAADKEIIRKYKNGLLKRDNNDQYKFYSADLEQGEQAFTYTVTTDSGKKLLEFTDNMVETFVEPSISRRITWESKTEPTSKLKVGKIGTPEKGGANPEGVVNWLGMGFTKNYSNKVWTASEEWLGGDWDTWLYADD